MRFKFIDILLFVLLLIFTSCFPYDKLGLSLLYQNIIAIGLKLLVLIYYIYVIYKNNIKVFGIANLKSILVCLPFLIACFSNLIAFKIDGGQLVSYKIDSSLFAVQIVLVLMSAILEEIVFRFFIHNSFIYVGSIKRIICSAGIFALMHLINIINVSSVDALMSLFIQVVYTFGLGLMLGFLYEYSHSLIACVGLHFLFNLFNSLLLTYFYPNTSELVQYITALVIAAVLIVYSLLINNYLLKKSFKD